VETLDKYSWSPYSVILWLRDVWHSNKSVNKLWVRHCFLWKQI